MFFLLGFFPQAETISYLPKETLVAPWENVSPYQDLPLTDSIPLGMHLANSLLLLDPIMDHW